MIVPVTMLIIHITTIAIIIAATIRNAITIANTNAIINIITITITIATSTKITTAK